MTETPMLRLVTQSVRDAEDAVLAALLIDPPFAIAECQAMGLTSAAFSDPANALLYRAIRWLEREGTPVDPITLAAALEARGKLAAAGGRELIGLLLHAIPTAANVRYHAQLVRDAAQIRDGDHRSEHEAVQAEQVREAIDRLDLPEAAYLRFPFAPLDAVLGGHGPGTVGFVVARSASGKTSFLLSAMHRWHARGLRIYYAGLESKPLTLRTQWACRALRVDPGDVLSGAYRAWPGAAAMRQAIKDALAQQYQDPAYLRVRFSPHPTVNLRAMTEICIEAHDFGADVIIVDHIDHVHADGSPYAASREVIAVALELAHRYDLHLLLASQINREGMSTDPFRNHRAVREEAVKMGDHKLEIADYMFGVYRPLRADLSKQDRADYVSGVTPIARLLAPHTMGVNVLKHRLYGARAGTRLALGFARGEVFDTPAEAEQVAGAAKYLHWSA